WMYRKAPSGLTSSTEAPPVVPGNGEPLISVSVPSAAAEATMTCPFPLSGRNTVLPSGEMSREKKVGLRPTATGEGEPGRRVSAPVAPSIEKMDTESAFTAYSRRLAAWMRMQLDMPP